MVCIVAAGTGDLLTDPIADFVHVLSLKGQFHYVSPSVSRVLEYEPEDLLNKHISDICHPSDIVPVMRELKDSSQTPQDGQPPKPFNLLFRIRRKYSGYIWLESSGRLHVEAGKSRKAVILTGRERCLPSIKWKTIDDHGGLGDCELWANLSFDGLILWASGTVDQVMGVQSEEVVGKSYYAFLPGGDNGAPSPDGSTACLAVQKAIAQAAQGLPRKGAVSVRHQLRGATGRMFEVTSTFYAAGCRGGATGITSPAAATPDSSDSEASADSSRSKIGTEVRPSHILMQVKMSGPQWPRRQNPLVNSSKENVFEEMDTTRGTSWQYEIHQLRIANRKLNEEVISARSAIAEQLGGGPDDEAKKKGKKRKMQQASLDRGRANPLSLPINSRLGIPAPLMDHPAPLHQQTPGFGLAPGQLYKTW
jgi:PAS domain S-box-containing protein